MFEKPLFDRKMIQDSTHGHVEKPMDKLARKGESLDQTSLRISDEYAKLVQEFPEYEFGIVADNTNNLLRMTWKRRKAE